MKSPFILPPDIEIKDGNGKLHGDPALKKQNLEESYDHGVITKRITPVKTEYFKGGVLDRIEYKNGKKEYYLNGKLHRGNDLPAITHKGTKEWYENGQLHRVNGPAIETNKGRKKYYLHGVFQYEEDEKGNTVTRNSRDQLHSLNDQPSLIGKDGTKRWHHNGLLHRKNGPAIESHDGKLKTYYKHGKEIKIEGKIGDFKF